MTDMLAADASSGTRSVRRRVCTMYAGLVGGNLFVWLWALFTFRDHPVLLGTALVAYSLGLRHAVDADHIAAIDNVTRKLMQEGQRPVAVGFYFALGHSTVVMVASIAIAVVTSALKDQFSAFREIGGIIGTSASALFLLVIAIANLVVFASLYRAFRALKHGESLREEDVNDILGRRGAFVRLFRPLFGFVNKSWHVYPIGLLFAFGFETATEISLFGISASEAAHDISLGAILVFPALFTAGMTLIDTTDGILMLGAYGWAFIKPVRKLYYNMTITFVSVLVALLVGGIEALGLVANQLNLEGGFWNAIAALNENFGALGYAIIGIFVMSWLASLAVYRLRGYDRLEVEG